MSTKQEIEDEFPLSPEQYSGEENVSGVDSEHEDPEEPESPDNKNSVAKLLEQLQSSGALVKKPVVVPVLPPKEYRCYKCDLTYPDWDTLEDHLLQHVTLPSVLVDKLPSDDESEPDREPGDEDWSDEEPEEKPKVDVSELLKNKYLSIKKTETSPAKVPDSALDKLAGLGGFTIKKNSTPIKTEEVEPENKDDLMQKLGKLGGLKLKLQTTSQGNKSSFKIVNGLNDFNADEEEDWSGKEDEVDRSGESEEIEKIGSPKEPSPDKNTDKQSPQTTPIKPSPNVNITNVVRIFPNSQNQKNGVPTPPTTVPKAQTPVDTMTDVVVKNEPLEELPPANFTSQSSFSSEVKSECPTPPLSEVSSLRPLCEVSSLSSIKTEAEDIASSGFHITDITDPPDPPVEPKKEKDDSVTIIEINGDSNDEDDDCCVVSATPAADIKPKIENVNYPPASLPYSSQPPPVVVPPGNILTSALSSGHTYSTEKQHSFNWNAPDQPKPELLEKSADAIFASLLASSNHKKEPVSMSEASEYISLDNLHTCEVCHTRFTDTTLLENHRRSTGHSKSLVSSTPSALLPVYSSPSNSLLSSLLPVKHLADQVGRLVPSSSVGTSGGPFTHQQNMIINIQAYPGQGMMPPQQQYGAYPGHQQPMSGSNYGVGNMFRMPGQPPGPGFSGAYPPAGQYPPHSFSGGTQPGYMAAGPAYSQASPLQGMQQQVYGPGGPGSQPIGLQPGQMAPGQIAPGQLGSPHQFPTPSSPNSMKPPPAPGNIRIQNVQSYSPGQSAGALGQPLRGAAPMRGGSRPRMPGVRPGMRPSVRPGLQVQGAVRGSKPGGLRMPMKRPAGPMPGAGAKKRMDMLLPGKHDNEDCTVMAMQNKRDGLPMIHSVQGSKDNFGLGSGISITKKTVNKEASGMASLLAARGIMVKQKAKSRSPSPERPLPHIPNLGAGVSIKHTSKNSQFSIPEARVGGSMNSCRICKKMFMNSASLSVHMSTAHPSSKVPAYSCEECPASYPKAAQLQHHRRVFHNVSGPDRELGLPIVDLSQEENLKKLSDLGIYSFIPLANREQASGCFGIPVISVHNMNNGMVRGLTALGADGLLSLGPLKPLPNT